VVPADRHVRTDQRESPDKIEPALAAEPIEKAEATEPTEPIERIEPAEPMDKIEPAEPMDKIDPLDPMLRSEPAELERGEPLVVSMRAFSQLWPISGIMRVSVPLAGVLCLWCLPWPGVAVGW
jgi:hypothetical protein